MRSADIKFTHFLINNMKDLREACYGKQVVEQENDQMEDMIPV